MKVLHDKGIFSIEGITVINPELIKDAWWRSDNRINSPISRWHWENIILRDGDSFDLPENIIAELDEIDTVEDGGGCYVAGSKTVYRLKLKEPLVEEKAMKVKCNCPCHKNKAYKHVIQCCEDGYIEFPKFPKEQSSLVDTGSKESIDIEAIVESVSYNVELQSGEELIVVDYDDAIFMMQELYKKLTSK